ncbi:MAG: hypothetical protein A2086_17040 [Spirochaetes bacterium GWD1_27_9]|nr:MAG: hypothetical protein A2Z98_15365 [Spirochaetes bacterium GWB1_27_13]OHD27375.1 MAG: hypothetical protein A2Y34_07630 [Spirochaetes bacterium GWC1_27_15]OHD33335.1 MAG: hypothetical protein A2086_17040 [Spirochaetes bacterium GWD1_27_9]
MKKMFLVILNCFSLLLIFCEIPYVSDNDIIFEKSDGGYDLYIKKLPGIESILLTESQKDPFLKKHNYGLRTEKFHHANGDEIRILEGKELHTKYDAFFLVDSTTENHSDLGECFYFFLPEKVLFGYNWSRKGFLKIRPGIKINLRLFEKKYSDYSGNFKDQWITLKIKYSTSNFRPNLVENFKDITNGNAIIKNEKDDLKSIFENDIPDKIKPDQSADVVFIIDTTLSMKEEIPIFKEAYPKIKEKILSKVKNLRLGLILYKDYGEIYVTKDFDLESDFTEIDNLIENLMHYGGEDIPEAVYEAIYDLNKFNFTSDNRYAFLIGDAPAHPKPRGKVTKEDALNTIKEKNINFEGICLPFR